MPRQGDEERETEGGKTEREGASERGNGKDKMYSGCILTEDIPASSSVGRKALCPRTNPRTTRSGRQAWTRGTAEIEESTIAELLRRAAWPHSAHIPGNCVIRPLKLPEGSPISHARSNLSGVTRGNPCRALPLIGIRSSTATFWSCQITRPYHSASNERGVLTAVEKLRGGGGDRTVTRAYV